MARLESLIWRHGDKVTVKRAQIVRASILGKTVPEICAVVGWCAKTAREGIRAFNAWGFESLWHGYQGGPPLKSTRAVRHAHLLGELWEPEEIAPWSLNKQGKRPEVAACLYNIAETVRILSILLSPFLPSTCEKIWTSLGLRADKSITLDAASRWGALKGGMPVQKIPVLFSKFKE